MTDIFTSNQQCKHFAPPQPNMGGATQGTASVGPFVCPWCEIERLRAALEWFYQNAPTPYAIKAREFLKGFAVETSERQSLLKEIRRCHKQISGECRCAYCVGAGSSEETTERRNPGPRCPYCLEFEGHKPDCGTLRVFAEWFCPCGQALASRDAKCPKCDLTPLCAVCDQIEALHPKSHKFIPKASAKPWTRGGNPEGTHLVGYAHMSYSKVVEVFGEPECHGDRGDSRVIFEWVMTFADGTVATIYDYKQSKLYGDDPNAPTPDEMKTLPSFEWHIGGKSQRAVELVHSALNGRAE